MCDCFISIRSIKRHENDRQTQNPLLTVHDNAYGTPAATINELQNPTATMTLVLKSWLNGHWFRYIILLICSPLLIPIVFVVSPFICVAEVCFCLCRRRLKSTVLQTPAPVVVVPTPVPRQQEEERKVSLLDRYLEDQLGLALEILDECGGDLGYCYDYIDGFDDNNNRSNSLC